MTRQVSSTRPAGRCVLVHIFTCCELLSGTNYTFFHRSSQWTCMTLSMYTLLILRAAWNALPASVCKHVLDRQQPRFAHESALTGITKDTKDSLTYLSITFTASPSYSGISNAKFRASEKRLLLVRMRAAQSVLRLLPTTWV